MQQLARRLVILFALPALLLASPCDAVVEVDGDPAFEQAAQACFDKFLAAGGEVSAKYQEMLESPKTIRIVQTRDNVNKCGPDNDRDAMPVDAGGTGAGSDSTVHWNPSNTREVQPGVARDPCASLFHEMVHGCEMAEGTLDMRPDRATRIKRSEISATRFENRFRKAEGLPQRTEYSGKPLPADAIFND